MKRLNTLVFIALLFLIGCSNKQTRNEKIWSGTRSEWHEEFELSEGRVLELDEKVAFSGQMILLSEDGQKLKEGIILEGYRHGMYKSYYDNGNIRELGNYKFGKLDGRWQVYYPDGNTFVLAEYADDEYNGVFNIYLLNGSLIVSGNMKDGKRHGEYKTFYRNGMKQIEAEYEYGKLDGYYREYDTNGDLVLDEKYRDGERVAD